MDVREKLVELLRVHPCFDRDCFNCEKSKKDCWLEELADLLIANGVTVQEPKGAEIDSVNKWIPVSEPPTEYRDKYGELIPFLVCLEGTEYPFRAMYDGKVWGDGLSVIPVTYWMPLPEPQKGVQDGSLE